MKIFIGYEPRETNAYLVACASIRKYWPDAPIQPLILNRLRNRNLYTRPVRTHDGQMFDEISDAPMSTEFAVSRFLTPILAESGLALFIDCDMLIRADLRELFALADLDKAVMCVKHKHVPVSYSTKMDSQIQTRYTRKNWSSVMLWNCDHLANKKLTLELVNALSGRALHAFCWLEEELIGELGSEWNFLVGETSCNVDPKIVHFTNGIPSMPGYEQCEFSDEWRAILDTVLERL